MSGWKPYRENTYVSGCRGKEFKLGHPELPGKAWRLNRFYFSVFLLLSFFFFFPSFFFFLRVHSNLKRSQVISRVMQLFNFTHRGTGSWIGPHRETLVKRDISAAAMWGSESILRDNNSSGGLQTLQTLRWNGRCRARSMFLLVSGCGMQPVYRAPRLLHHMNLGGNGMKPSKADFTLYKESV